MGKNFSQVELKPGERIDDLLFDDLKIIQNELEFCFSLDAILLAYFATLKKNARVIDLGAGTGVIGLLLAARGAKEVVGVEINPVLADMAARSASLNRLSDKIRLINGDLRLIREVLPAGEWETVVTNPPYRQLGKGKVSPKSQVAMAKHEVGTTLQDVIDAARFLLKYRGRLAIVHLPERLAEIVYTMRQAQIEPKRLQLVYPRLGKAPNMLLIEGVRGAKSGLSVLPPLLIYNHDGAYSQDILKMYEKEGHARTSFF